MKFREFLLLLSFAVFLAGCAGGPRPLEKIPDSVPDSAPGAPSGGPFSDKHAGSWNLAFSGAASVWRFLYEIAPWPGFKTTAYSITFDDGTLDQYLLAFPALGEKDLKATFYIITGPRSEGFWNDSGTQRALFSWDQAREIAAAGHEIASHTATHRDLSASKAETVGKELYASIEDIHREIPGGLPGRLSFAWPYWRSSAQAGEMVNELFTAARSGSGSIESYLSKPERASWKTPPDSLALSAATMRTRDTEETLISLRGGTEFAGGWNILSFHGIDDGIIEESALGWDPCPLERFNAIIGALSEMNAWTAPVGRVVRYIRERDTAGISLIAVSTDRILLHLSDGLDNSEYTEPVTARFLLPPGWEAVRVTQEGRNLPSSVSEGFCTIDAVPNGGLIIVDRF